MDQAKNGAMAQSKRPGILAIVFGVLCLYTIATAIAFSIISARQHAEFGLPRENMSWAGSHFQTEFYKLEHRVAAFAADATAVNAKEVRLRYDILLSRLDILATTRIRDAYADNPDLLQVFESMRNGITALDPLMQGIAAGRADSGATMAQALNTLELPVARIAGAYNEFAAREKVRLLESAEQVTRWLNASLAGQIVTLLILGGFLWRRMRDLRPRSRTPTGRSTPTRRYCVASSIPARSPSTSRTAMGAM
jgi:hypothetical protein